MAYERAAGREPVDVSAARDGSGFDIRSTARDPAAGEIEVRRIEVKGRSAHHGDVEMPRWKVCFRSLDQWPSLWRTHPACAARVSMSRGERVTTSMCPPGRSCVAACLRTRTRSLVSRLTGDSYGSSTSRS